MLREVTRWSTSLSTPTAARADAAAPSQAAFDNLVSAGILASNRRPNVDSPIGAGVHGLAVHLRGPLHFVPEREQTRVEN